MTPPSASPSRLSRILLIALIVPLTSLGQAARTQGVPAQATSSQAAAAPSASAQSSSSQATTPATGSPVPTPAALRPSTAPNGQAATAPPGNPTATAPAAGTATSSALTDTGPSYDIEIVIFRTKAALGQPENWAAETTASTTVAGDEASSGSGGVGKLLTVLPSSDYRLTAIASRLGTSGSYLPVAHAAWMQTASAWGTHAGFPLESLGVSVPGLTGVISLERGQYLHLGMTLNYTMQDPPPGLDAPAGTTFVMNETRRVRFYQRNYYDHPAFGVIALITPARGRRPPGR